MGSDMAAKLLDANGKLKPFRQWLNDVSSISTHHCGAWLRTEYDTAIIRAHNAADWQSFLRNKDVMPNLRWMPTTSPNPESSHRKFWEKKLTLPVDDPFWSKHHPGDRWNCKCSLEATDDPVNRPDDIDGVDPPQRGLENNPGKDGHTFSDNHPYFPSGCSSCPFNKGFKNQLGTFFKNEKKHCMNCSKVDAKINAIEISKERKIIRAEARASLSSKSFYNANFPHQVKITGAGIKEWLNQPHKHIREKNRELLNLEKLFNESKYLGPTIDKKEREDVACSHIFETIIANEKSWIIVHEKKWGEYVIHSISDSDKVVPK